MKTKELFDSLILPEGFEASFDEVSGTGIVYDRRSSAELVRVRSQGADWVLNDQVALLEEILDELAMWDVAVQGASPEPVPEPVPEPRRINHSPLPILLSTRDFLEEISVHMTQAAERHEDWIRLSAQHGPDWLYEELSSVQANALVNHASQLRDHLREVNEELAARRTALEDEAIALRRHLTQVAKDIQSIQ